MAPEMRRPLRAIQTYLSAVAARFQTSPFTEPTPYDGSDARRNCLPVLSGLGRRFAALHSVSGGTMSMVDGMRTQLLGELTVRVTPGNILEPGGMLALVLDVNSWHAAAARLMAVSVCPARRCIGVQPNLPVAEASPSARV